MSGQISHYAGEAAEDIVSRFYSGQGYAEQERRWRGPVGEIDLILSQDGMTVFVEVKKSKDFATAASRVSARQIGRIEASAAGYMARLALGQSSEARIDVALVDAAGAVEVLENVTLH
ncbi:hypothetical protein AIOL_003262 [Candidatus Rhodobacter oscarellae]|uniref:UPF0102 protein AIOL_003262 n=1 Tax=Candidatus Rhodobacter oscarellae TaxID=1675527 RepID=A0A0J9E692_9RHOB|nr:YraN family protein [Candidatus Rhodobacter lobularis]KMW58290.1 hypothetical protein AIOL_003262 [Candidatus Rhodobacter lobularis]